MAKILFLSIFAIILCVYPLYTSAQASVFSYVEQNNDNGRPPRVLTARKFDDGTVVARIVKDVEGTPTCRYDMLSLRFIKPDGTVDAKDFNLSDLQVQQFNYCIPEGDLDYQLIRKDQILVTYYASIEGGIFEQWGVIINLDGKELSRQSLGITVRPNSKLQLNTDRTKGFLMLASTYSTDGSDLIYTSWVQYKIEENGAFTKLTEGSLTIDFFLSPTATVMSTVGEGYAIAYAVMKNNYVAENPLLSQGTLYALTIGYNQTTVSPLLLYQTPLPDLSFRALFCDISFAGVGQVCTLTVSQVTGGVTSNFYVKVNFLSSGSVTSSKVISRAIPDDDPSFIWRVDSLPFGGFLFTNVTNTNPNNIWGYLFGEEETTPAPWGLSYPEPINLSGVFQILPNNTLLVFQEGADDNSWQYESIVLPRFDGKEDTGYSNVNVLSTIPGIGQLIDENATTSVQIAFYNPVELSESNLIIYQMGDKPSLRQKIPGLECTLVPDSNDTIVDVTVLISTFSVPNGNYFIMMENNFVKDKAYKEPLLGIRENVWYFTTNEETIELTPSKSGLFRLSVDGTSYYDTLDKKGRQNFFSKLRDELAVAVPVDSSRFITIEKAQLDRSVNERQYLISIGVKDNKDKNDISVASIIDYISTMVENKEQTQIGMGEVTKYLDHTYGFNRMLNIWERYRTILIVLFFLIIFLLGSFLSAHVKTKRDQKDNDTKKDIKNIAILQLGLIIFDLIVDILFVSNSSKDFPELYIPSVVFLTLPIAINTTLAFYIITQENSLNQKFYQWFIKNGKIASVFTVLAGADIEALNILHSNLLGVELFGAPFSLRAKRIINQGGYANIFTEDIPQVIIQIIYYRKAVYYGLVPLLTFISSVLTLAINFATILYETFISKKSETPTGISSSTPSTG